MTSVAVWNDLEPGRSAAEVTEELAAFGFGGASFLPRTIAEAADGDRQRLLDTLDRLSRPVTLHGKADLTDSELGRVVDSLGGPPGAITIDPALASPSTRGGSSLTGCLR